MKKTYQTPALLVVAMEIANLMDVGSVQGNSDLKLSTTGSDEVARSREDDYWDDDY